MGQVTCGLHFSTEMKGFEPLCRDEPTNAFRVRRVMATSLHLHNRCLSDRQRLDYTQKIGF